MKSEHVMQSYVWYGEQLFFVSTINRDSSACYGLAPRYAETMVWECDPKTRERYQSIFWMGDGPKDTLSTHFEACRALRETGKIDDEDGDG